MYDKAVTLSAMAVTNKLIVLGCATCSNNDGWIKLYDRDTLEQLYRVDGTSTNNKIGASLSL